MVGYLRLILAYFVLLSHINWRVYDMNPGVFAVVSFYILSGYVVTHLWDNIFPEKPNRLWFFYRDRILRIFPLYLYVFSVTLAFVFFTGYGQPNFVPSKLLANALIVPLNYFMWYDTTILTDPAWCLIPPAWSLGAEEQAYLLLSVLLVVRPLKYLLAPASLFVFIVASLGWIHTDYYGYRLLPGVFFMFVAGHCLCRIHYHKATIFDRVFPVAVWACVLGVFIWLLCVGGYQYPYIRETSLGLIFGVPCVYFVNRFKKRLPGNALAGALSYGVFLSHFLVIWFVDYCRFPKSMQSIDHAGYVCIVTALTLLVAWVGIRVIEKPVDKIRKNI